MTIIVSGNRIRDIGPSDELGVPRGATVINAAGQFAIPGLWDMHVHVLQDGVYQRTSTPPSSSTNKAQHLIPNCWAT